MPDNMGEQLRPREEKAGKSESNQPKHDHPIIQPESLVDSSRFHMPHLPIPADVSMQREQKASEAFRRDVAILKEYDLISDEMSRSAISKRPPKKFPDSTQLLEAYDKASADDKKKFRSGLNKRANIETLGKILISEISEDLTKLLKDQGKNSDEIREDVEESTTLTIGKKRRHISQLPREIQLSLIQNAANRRKSLLIGNFANYRYLLTYSDPDPLPSTLEESHKKRVEEFENSDPERQASISARTREIAEMGLRETFDINLKRLAELETRFGHRKPQGGEIDNWRAHFDNGTLTAKANLISKIQERKLELAEDELMNIRQLRRTIETTFEIPRARIGEDLTSHQGLTEEVSIVIAYLTGIALSRHKLSSLGERQSEDLKELISDFGPELKEAFEIVLLLRPTPNEFFKL